MSGEERHGYRRRSAQQRGQRRAIGPSFQASQRALFPDQDQGKPGRPGEDHGVDRCRDHEEAEAKPDPRRHPADAARPQGAEQEVGEEPCQGQVERREPAVGGGQRQDVVDDAKWVERGVLACGQEGDAGEEIGVPQGQFPILDRLQDQPLPGVVLEDEVAHQTVLGDPYPKLLGKGRPRRKAEQNVERDEALSSQRDRPKQDERQDDESQRDHRLPGQVTPSQKHLRSLAAAARL